jgi:hypothetical protein
MMKGIVEKPSNTSETSVWSCGFIFRNIEFPLVKPSILKAKVQTGSSSS